MDEYIKRETALQLLDALASEPQKQHAGEDWAVGVSLAIGVIEDITAADVVELKNLTPCDVCAHNPPSSFGGKPCGVCPASAKIEEEKKDG